ncbi:MAG: hypothetical protein FWF22_03415, partial [Treponema sp.]|nr:hypothetical protein [Treponema sp.]
PLRQLDYLRQAGYTAFKCLYRGNQQSEKKQSVRETLYSQKKDIFYCPEVFDSSFVHGSGGFDCICHH